MKKALFVTNCSIEAASALAGWKNDKATESIGLTVVHPYDLTAGEPLNKGTLQEAKQQAQTRLQNWIQLLSTPNNLQAETLLAPPQLAVTIHLMLRSYDYVFVDDHWDVEPLMLTGLLGQSGVQVHQLCAQPA